MAHLYERYLTNSKEVEVTDRLIEALLLTMVHETPQDWNSHNIEHELSAGCGTRVGLMIVD